MWVEGRRVGDRDKNTILNSLCVRERVRASHCVCVCRQGACVRAREPVRLRARETEQATNRSARRRGRRTDTGNQVSTEVSDDAPFFGLLRMDRPRSLVLCRSAAIAEGSASFSGVPSVGVAARGDTAGDAGDADALPSTSPPSSRDLDSSRGALMDILRSLNAAAVAVARHDAQHGATEVDVQTQEGASTGVHTGASADTHKHMHMRSTTGCSEGADKMA
jgi:hypothetical protein